MTTTTINERTKPSWVRALEQAEESLAGGKDIEITRQWIEIARVYQQGQNWGVVA